MECEKPLAAQPGGTAPAPHSQEEIRHLVATALTHLAVGTALSHRCGKAWSQTPRDTPMLYLVARIASADAVLGKRLAKLIAPPRRKAKAKRQQSLDLELNSRSLHSDGGKTR